MKLLCSSCDTALQLEQAADAGDGTLVVTFGCPSCDQGIHLLTNPGETQLVRALGVRLGGRTTAPPPLQGTRAFLRHPRPELGMPATPGGTADREPAADPAPEPGAGPQSEELSWTPEARERLDRVPPFVRPLVQSMYEDYARERHLRVISPQVMDEARRSGRLEGHGEGEP